MSGQQRDKVISLLETAAKSTPLISMGAIWPI